MQSVFVVIPDLKELESNWYECLHEFITTGPMANRCKNDYFRYKNLWFLFGRGAVGAGGISFIGKW